MLKEDDAATAASSAKQGSSVLEDGILYLLKEVLAFLQDNIRTLFWFHYFAIAHPIFLFFICIVNVFLHASQNESLGTHNILCILS